MTVVHVAGLSVFVLLFAATAWRSVNMGILAFAAAFVVGAGLAGQATPDVVAGFPSDLFVILVGVTLLFGFAKTNGTVDQIVATGVRVIGGREALVPWLMFALSALLCGIGALGPAVVAILYPVGMGFVSRQGIRPMLIGMMVSFGGTAGSFSPIGVFGIIVNQVMRDQDLPTSPGLIFLFTFVAGTLAAAVAFLTCGGPSLLGRRHPGVEPTTPPVEEVPGSGGTTSVVAPRILSNRVEQVATLAALTVLVVGAIGFDLDIGLLAIALAAVLSLVFPGTVAGATANISWSVVLLVGGVVTYVAVLEAAGTVTWLGESVSAIGMPLLAALVVCVIAAAVSAFASTTAMLGALFPLSVPLMLEGDISIIGLAAALSISSSLVDTSPFSTVGALAIASSPAEEQRRVYRGLLAVGMSLIVIAPLASWLLLVVPNWL